MIFKLATFVRFSHRSNMVLLHAEKLTVEAKLCSLDKIKLDNNTDPYLLSTTSLSSVNILSADNEETRLV